MFQNKCCWDSPICGLAQWLLSIFLGHEDTSRPSVTEMASLQKESMMEEARFIVLFLFLQQTLIVLEYHIIFLFFLHTLPGNSEFVLYYQPELRSFELYTLIRLTAVSNTVIHLLQCLPQVPFGN